MEVPEHAKRTESTYVSMPVDHIFTDCEMGHDGEGFYVRRRVGNETLDLTEKYLKWVETQPLIHRVTYEWTEERE